MKNNKKVQKRGRGQLVEGAGGRESKKKRQTERECQSQRANATVAANNLHKF